MVEITRETYSSLYGPTTGDRIRLADTELIIEDEKDHTIYGDEVLSSSEVIRDGMGRSQRNAAQSVDLVITNAVVLDRRGSSRPISGSRTATPPSGAPATRTSSRMSISSSARPRT